MDIMKIVGGLTEGILKFFDDAYRDGWLFYLLGGLILLFILGMFFT